VYRIFIDKFSKATHNDSMRFAILSYAKLGHGHGRGTLDGAAKHLLREIPTRNADPDRRSKNENHGPTKSVDEVLKVAADRLAPFTNKTGKNKGKLRGNAVVGIEVLVTASPEWFKDPAALNSGGTAKDYFDSAQQWLNNRFGAGNLILSVRHYDETSPHLQCIYLPIRERGGRSRLDGWAMLGGAESLKTDQTKFADEVGAEFGLVRGIKKSKMDHLEMGELYGQLKTPTPEIKTEEDIEIIKKKAMLYDMDQKNREARDRALAEMRKRTDNLRDIDLHLIMEKSGFEPTEKDSNNYSTPVGRISISREANKYMNHGTGKGGGGAIDLVKELHGFDFSEALTWLAQNFGDAARGAFAARAARAVERAAKQPAPDVLRQHAPTPRTWSQVKDYLVKVRAIPESLVEFLHGMKKVWSDRFANAVFPLNDPKNTKEVCGLALRGTGSEPFRGVRGRKGVYLLSPTKRDQQQIFAVESPIDAISKRVDGYTGPVVGTCGNPSDEVVQLLRRYAGKIGLILGFDNDEAGDKIASMFEGERVRPVGKDWNEDLQKSLDKSSGISGADKTKPCGPSAPPVPSPKGKSKTGRAARAEGEVPGDLA
jgi:hypothetical protein